MVLFRYGWRYQIGPWVRRGYRVVVPDMLGYGGTQKPIEASDYSPKKICADLAALLDLLEIKSAVRATYERNGSMILHANIFPRYLLDMIGDPL